MNADKTAVEYDKLDLSEINPLTDIISRRETIRSKAKKIQKHLTMEKNKTLRLSHNIVNQNDATTNFMTASKK